MAFVDVLKEKLADPLLYFFDGPYWDRHNTHVRIFDMQNRDSDSARSAQLWQFRDGREALTPLLLLCHCVQVVVFVADDGFGSALPLFHDLLYLATVTGISPAL